MAKNEKTIFETAEGPLSVGLLVLPDSNMLSLASVVDPLRAANRRADRVLFRWQFLSPDGGPVALTSGLEIQTTPLPARPDFEALVVVAGFNLTEHCKPGLMRWLRDIAARMQGIGGVDGGSWILARASLLDGQVATTHWEDLEEFADVFPEVHLVRDRFTISGRFFTSGGAAPALDMMLQLIRIRHGVSLAAAVAGAFIYEPVQTADAPQMPVSTLRLERTAPKVAQAVSIMSGAVEDPVPMDEIAARVGLTRRGLELRFRKELGQSPGSFFLALRLQEARRLVLDTALSAQAVALRTGFTSQAVFARAFKRSFGMSATRLRRMHKS